MADEVRFDSLEVGQLFTYQEGPFRAEYQRLNHHERPGCGIVNCVATDERGKTYVGDTGHRNFEPETLVTIPWHSQGIEYKTEKLMAMLRMHMRGVRDEEIIIIALGFYEQRFHIEGKKGYPLKVPSAKEEAIEKTQDIQRKVDALWYKIYELPSKEDYNKDLDNIANVLIKIIKRLKAY